ncbi:MAG: prolipoprotein diacylglyceryl transferase [Candidatus Daviesbacteria bacterium]|nr:MAG: prolipoprotein diacylglyceryl transferase [Candidatus Daviesbacteria bacterium]
MLPVLFSLGNLSISSFGLFLSLGFLYGVFLTWRLSRAWDINEEKVLDLVLLVFFGGILGARLLFILEHLEFFLTDLTKVILLIKYPGFSFWGGILGGWLALSIFARRFRLDFWAIADVLVVGLLGGLILGQIGCLLGGCNVGVESELFLAVPQVGVVGKRLPIQAIEALILILVLRDIWKKAIHFHPPGKIVSTAFIYLGVVKLMAGFLKETHTIEWVLALVLILAGAVISYKISKRRLKSDWRLIRKTTPALIINSQTRAYLLSKALEFCYNQLSSFFKNQRIEWSWRLKDINKLLRKIHVKPTPKNFN